MSWPFNELRPTQLHGPVVPHQAWPRDEMQSIRASKRRRTLEDSWANVDAHKGGFVCGQIVGLDPHSIKASKLLYLKDGTHLGACVLRNCGLNFLVADYISVQVHELRPMEAFPQVNQVICTFPKIAVAFVAERIEVIPRLPLQVHTWEMEGPKLVTLSTASANSGAIQRIKLAVAKVLRTHADDLEEMHTICRDEDGLTAKMKLTGNYISASLIKAGACLVVSGALVSRFGEIYNIYVRPHTTLEVLPDQGDSQVPEYDAASEGQEACTLTIKDAILQLEHLPSDCDHSLTVSGYITGIGQGSRKLVSVCCPACNRKFLADHRWSRACTGCQERNPSLHSWRPRLGVSTTISDESGTWKHIYLDDQMATSVLQSTPEELLTMDDESLELLGARVLFQRVTLSLEVQKRERSKPAVRVLSIELDD